MDEEYTVTLTQDQAEALADWYREQFRPSGCTAYGPKFTAAMEVAEAVEDMLPDPEGVE